MASGDEQPVISIILNVMGRVELAAYGFRSWMLQETKQPYEVVLNLFNDQKPLFEKLAADRPVNCKLIINEYPRPAFFNISVANNLGIFAASAAHLWFCPADQIYISSAIDILKREAIDRGLVYAVATRWELNEKYCQGFKPAEQYTRQSNFDFLSGMEGQSDLYFRGWGYGWFVSTEMIRAVGGFDRDVIIAEDKDLADRARHYMKRTNLQDCPHAIGLFGFHLHHPLSELFRASGTVMPLLRARAQRLLDNPNGTDDIIPSRLGSREMLLEDLRNTREPAIGDRYRQDIMKKIGGRLRRAYQALRGQ